MRAHWPVHSTTSETALQAVVKPIRIVGQTSK
jgi:hypothetical protein